MQTCLNENHFLSYPPLGISIALKWQFFPRKTLSLKTHLKLCVSALLHVWVNCHNNQPVKQSIPKISPIKLVDKFIEVILEIFVGDHVVYSKKFPLQVTDCLMHPSERVVGGILSGNNREMGVHNIFKL